MPPDPDLRSTLAVRIDLASTLAPLRVGVSDPCWRVEASGAWWWATNAPGGAVTVRLVPGEDEVGVEAWGDGVAWMEQHLPRLIGATDPGPSRDGSRLVKQLQKRARGFRVGATGRVADAAIQGVCRRGVSTFEAARSWTLMVDAMGDDAPGPGGLRLPPNPRRLASCDAYDLHVMGLEHSRANEIQRIASHATRLELKDTSDGEQAISNLLGMPGLGRDAAAHARAVALGDPDAIPVVDLHLANTLVRALWSDEAGGSTDIADLLEPHAPDRGRLVRLIALAEAAASGA